MFSSDTKLRDGTSRPIPEVEKEIALDLETMDDTLEAEISKLETTLNSIKDDLPEVNDSSELEEGEIIDSIITVEDTKGKKHEKNDRNGELPNDADSTDGEIIDSDVERMFFEEKKNVAEKKNVLKLEKINSRNWQRVYSDIDSTDGDIIYSDIEVTFFREKENYGKKKNILKLKKSSTGRNRPAIYSDIDSTDGERKDSNVEVRTRVKSREKNFDNGYLDSYKNVTHKHTKRSKPNSFSSIVSPGLLFSSDCINCKENSHVPIHKKKCDDQGRCCLNCSATNKKNMESKSCINIISNKFENTLISPKNLIPNKTRGKKRSNQSKSEESSFRIVVDNDSVTTGALLDIKKLSNNNESKKSSHNLPLKVEPAEEARESDESYIQLDISKELEDFLLYPDGFENESNANLNEAKGNMIPNTPHRPMIGSHKKWAPKLFGNRERFYVLDQIGEVSDQEEIVFDMSNSSSKNPVSKKESKCSLKEKVVKLNDVNSFKPIKPFLEKSEQEYEIPSNSLKSEVLNRNELISNTDKIGYKPVKRPNSTPPEIFLDRKKGKGKGTVILKKSKSISLYSAVGESEITKKAHDDTKESILIKGNAAKDIKNENISHDKEMRHVALHEDGHLKVVVNVETPVVVDNGPQLSKQIPIEIQTLVNNEVPVIDLKRDDVPPQQIKETDQLNVDSRKLVLPETKSSNDSPNMGDSIEVVFESHPKKENVNKESKIKETDQLNVDSRKLVLPETKSSNDSPNMEDSIEVAFETHPKKENVNKESKISVPDNEILSKDKVRIPEDVPKAPGKRDEDYVSNNPQENEDNNNPEWEILRKLETDVERYRAMRNRWRNLVIPDPNQNLTCRNWRMIHNATSSTVSCNDAKPSESTSTACTNPKINKNDSASTSSRRENRKRPRSADSAIVRNEHVEKRPRTQSCTTVYEVKLEQLRKNIEVEKQRIDNEEQLALLQLSYKQSEELESLQQSCSSYIVNDAINQLLSEQHEDVERIHQKFDKARRTVQDSSMNKVKILEKACEEVRAFHMFYSGLDPESHSGDTFYLTNIQLQELWETERLYDQYKIFYSV